MDMVNGADMRISSISLIIYCAYRYIFMEIWRMWGEDPLPILADSSIRSRPVEHKIPNLFREIMQNFAYLMSMIARSGEGGRR